MADSENKQNLAETGTAVSRLFGNIAYGGKYTDKDGNVGSMLSNGAIANNPELMGELGVERTKYVENDADVMTNEKKRQQSWRFGESRCHRR